MIALSDKAKFVLRCLDRGWCLDRAGKEGFGGTLHKLDKNDKHVSVSTMTELFSGGLILWNNNIDMWTLTDAGRKAMNAH